MTAFQPLRGVIAPTLTPFNDDLSIARDLYLAQAATMTQLTGVLMTGDLEDIRPLEPKPVPDTQNKG